MTTPITPPSAGAAETTTFAPYISPSESPREFTVGAIVLGVLLGLVFWLVDRPVSPERRTGADADSGPGVLFSSGLIAGGAIMGVVLAGLAARHVDEKFDLSKTLGAMATSNVTSIIAYVVLLAVPLYVVGRRIRSAEG